MNVVAHNLTAMNAQRQFGINTKAKAKSTEKLSSGYRINRAADDAANLAISEKMRRQIRGLTQASNNAQDGISLVQIADGAMAEVHDMLHRGTELSIQAANGTLSETDRQYIQTEIEQLKKEIDGIADRATFNEIKVLRGGLASDGGYASNVTINGSMPSWVTLSSTTQLEDAGWSTAPTRYTYTDASGTTKYLDHSNKHAEATLDFSAFRGTDAQIDELNGNGFHSTCCTCSKHYSVMFTKETSSSLDISGGHYIYKVGIGDLTAASGKGTGEELVKRILEATNNGAMDNHYTKMSVGNHSTYTSTLHIYDQRPLESRDAIGFPSDAQNIQSNEPYATQFGITARPSSGYGVFGPGYATAKESAQQQIIPSDIDIHVGAEANQKINIKLPCISSDRLGVATVDASTATGAQLGISAFKDSIKIVNEERSRMGAYQNRLEHTIKNLDNVVENTTAAESRIRDTDMASEMLNHSNSNILEQVGHAMMAQANQSNQGVLTLLQG